MKVDEPSGAFDGRWGLVEADMPSPTDAEYLQVDSPITLYLFLVILAVGGDLIPVDFSVRDICVLERDVDVVEEVVFHVVIVALWVFTGNRVVLIEVEGDHVLE